MNKNFEKNRLDLAYRRQLIYLNVVLVFISIGILSFVGTFIWNKDYLLQGGLITIIFLLVFLKWHSKIDKNLKIISNKIKEL